MPAHGKAAGGSHAGMQVDFDLGIMSSLQACAPTTTVTVTVPGSCTLCGQEIRPAKGSEVYFKS